MATRPHALGSAPLPRAAKAVALVSVCLTWHFRIPLPALGAGSPAQGMPASTPRPALRFDAAELPGRYYLGDGLGVNCTLTLQANGRFEFKWTGCLGEYDQNAGKWTLDGDVMVLTPERPNKRNGFRGMGVRFVPVRWGGRTYLVDEHEMPGFCAAASGETLPRADDLHGLDYLKLVGSGSSVPPVDGTPLIPERYREFYEKGPVTARVERVLPDGKVTLNRGSADRVRQGMLMTLDAFGRIDLEVLSVTEHASVAQPIYFWNSDRKVEPGAAFTSGSYRHRPRGTGYQRFTAPPGK